MSVFNPERTLQKKSELQIGYNWMPLGTTNPVFSKRVLGAGLVLCPTMHISPATAFSVPLVSVPKMRGHATMASFFLLGD